MMENHWGILPFKQVYEEIIEHAYCNYSWGKLHYALRGTGTIVEKKGYARNGYPCLQFKQYYNDYCAQITYHPNNYFYLDIHKLEWRYPNYYGTEEYDVHNMSHEVNKWLYETLSLVHSLRTRKFTLWERIMIKLYSFTFGVP